jgi:hypothetical protein
MQQVAGFWTGVARGAVLALGGFTGVLVAQETASWPDPIEFTREQDHANMQQQLGITGLRPGPSGQNDAPNAANYDESIANPFPDWPDLLTLANGERVTSAAVWWDQRRPEVAEAFEREVVGRIPANVPDVEWIVEATAEGSVAGRPVRA